jgi:hypothetical protein
MSARYVNPIARDGDFADPFVLRFNGRYYLYCTNPDLRCWSSSDLLSWRLEGPTIAPDVFPGLVPFAPEVVYSDGWFYLYTSPSGTGHRVLRSASPTGPFELVSGNVEHEIDGNVLIDDDGRWYFYWAGDEGIWGCEMPTPTTFGEPVLTGAQMNGWTEGPFVMKRDGRYYMTLTGNHYLNPAYRINAAVSDHPLRGYVDDPLNPVLLETQAGTGIGLGHSSSVVGPDLVSTWLAYHNLNPDESRDLNFARQLWGDGTLEVLGPVASAAVPRMPDVVGDEFWTTDTGDGDFTAEVTLSGGADAYGVLVGDLRVTMPDGFAQDAWHTLRIVRRDAVLEGFVDGRRQLELDAPQGPIRFGVFGAATGYCAFTNSTAEAADRAADRPVPGRFWAALGEYVCDVAADGEYVLYLTGEFEAGDAVGVTVADGDEAVVQAGEATRVLVHRIRLGQGPAILRLRAHSGRPRVALVTVLEDAGVRDVVDAAELDGFGKVLLAPGAWHDFDLETELALEPAEAWSHGDVIFRATQLCEGGSTGTDTVLGIDFFLGYSVQLSAAGVRLARHDYDTKVLAEAVVELTGPVRIGVRMRGAAIEVLIAGVTVIRYDDPLPHLVGGLGLRVAGGSLQATAFSATVSGSLVRP